MFKKIKTMLIILLGIFSLVASVRTYVEAAESVEGNTSAVKRVGVNSKIKVKFFGNEGKLSFTEKKVNRGQQLGKFPKISRANYELKGWYTQEVGGKKVTTQQIVKNQKHANYYAHWKVATIKLDAKKLLFGAKGKQLQLNLNVTPKNADLSDLKVTSSNPDVVTAETNGQVTAQNFGKTTIAYTVDGKTAQVEAQVAKKWVAMTFDDGPWETTPKLVKGLEKRNEVATFFVVGENIPGKTKLLKRMARNGYEIDNHTWNHRMNSTDIRGDLAKTDAKLRKAIGKNSLMMRPPGGGLGGNVKKCGKPIMLWQVDTNDWRDRNTDIVYKRVVNQTRSGDIVLMHDIHATSIPAALAAYDTLAERGYAFVTVEQLLGNPKNNKIYYKGSKHVRTMKIQ
ncbi:hypothetical protein EQG49_05680 [Periweissella cryptocerci]|uniref:NodB homology domain-containing protein n=1 Tax=Periweissella cryptocerci TaxID=2506420 RepID=A0A4V1AIM1_9LACO|nr:polysaccharide deacetylase family protein [Periweissella cryptocerci]QBO35985.1 hypothetical protein EQG49_05680 [Periweissella cryptocerci]